MRRLRAHIHFKHGKYGTGQKQMWVGPPSGGPTHTNLNENRVRHPIGALREQ